MAACVIHENAAAGLPATTERQRPRTVRGRVRPGSDWEISAEFLDELGTSAEGLRRGGEAARASAAVDLWQGDADATYNSRAKMHKHVARKGRDA